MFFFSVMAKVPFTLQKTHSLHAAFPLLVLLYVLTRLAGLVFLVSHNDEAIYTQYAQMISADWQVNKFISVDGFFWNDYKEPLQFWMTSLTVNLFHNPLYGVRLWSVLFGLLGFVYTYKLFCALWGRDVGLVSAVLCLFSQYFFYFDVVNITEHFVYGSGAVFLCFFHRFLQTLKWSALAVSLPAFSLALNCKPSAEIWLALGFCVLLYHSLITGTGGGRTKKILEPWKVFSTRFGINFCMVSARVVFSALCGLWGVVVLSCHFILARLIVYLLIPAEFAKIRHQGSPHALVRDFGGLFDLPVREWVNNIIFYFSDVLFLDVFGIPLMLLCLVLFLPHAKFINKKSGLILACGLWVVTFVPQIVFMKVALLRHFGMGLYFWYGLLACLLVDVFGRMRARYLRYVFTGCVVCLLGGQIFYLFHDLFKSRQTEAGMVEGHTGFANGLGTETLITKVKTFKRGILVYDLQWGLPGTLLQVYDKDYPQLTLFPFKASVVREFKLAHEATRTRGETGVMSFSRKTLRGQMVDVRFGPDDAAYFVFDSARLSDKTFMYYNDVFNDPVLCRKKEVVDKVFRGRALEGSSLVICEME
ncbi:MAG: glycosyltransferase family 39 protein [Deltaproteobacteria bacterium]|nr:glycosyltransferase family 39 protein [Deltaproteobacteria bacterium]